MKLSTLTFAVLFVMLAFVFISCASGATAPEEEWSKTFGGSDYDRGFSVQQTSDGGYIIAGLTSSFGAGRDDVYLIKTYENGNEEWSKTFGGSDYDRGFSVQQTSDGGYIIAGLTSSFGAGGSDFYLIKTDKNGNEEWSKTFGGSGSDAGTSVQQTSDGGYIIGGHTNSFGVDEYDHDFYLIKTDKKGKVIGSKTFVGGPYQDKGNSVQQTSDGGYIICGFKSSVSPRHDVAVWLIKVGEELEPASEIPTGEEEKETPTPTETKTPSDTEPSGDQKETPGFEAMFAITGLLAVTYLIRRKDK